MLPKICKFKFFLCFDSKYFRKTKAKIMIIKLFNYFMLMKTCHDADKFYNNVVFMFLNFHFYLRKVICDLVCLIILLDC